MAYKFSFKLFLATLFLGFSAIGAGAASLIVNVTGDPNGAGNCTTGGTCSLRQAIASAVADDGIFFDIPAANCPGGVCTINLASGLTISRNLNIIGTGTRSLIINASASSGGQTTSVFNITNDAFDTYISVAFSGLTITGGNSSQATTPKAGGITAGSKTTVSLNYVTVTNNQGSAVGGIYCNKANTFPINTAFGCNLTLTNSLVSDNTGSTAGGIENHGTMQIANSTISGNLANRFSGFCVGGISNDANELNEYLGILNINSSTITNNSTVSNVGIGGISGNFSSPNLPRLRNTIVANNLRANQVRDINANFTSLGNNLIGSTFGGGGADGNGGFPGSNDIINQPANLAPLADNGGQSNTHALLPNSRAVNRGNNCVRNASCATDNPPMNLEFDQRAQPFSRQFDATIDIGAFEFQQNVVIRKTPFDFDGDGRADIAVTRVNNNALAWYELNSVYGFNAVNFGSLGDRLVPADYDGDGKTDIAVVRTNTDNTVTWYILRSRDGLTAQTFGFALDAVVPADYDGDGKADVAVIRNVSGAFTWYINRSTAGFTAFQFGAQDDVPVVGDYDGDGKSDIAVFRPTNATWYLQQSTAGFSAIAFGLGTDKPVPADYDGDGKTNVAVFRPSNGTWYTSTNAAINYGAVQFGASGDKPVPADYDGDGKTDVAVTRASGGNLNWYINGSQSGFTGVGFGASSDRAVENAYIP